MGTVKTSKSNLKKILVVLVKKITNLRNGDVQIFLMQSVPFWITSIIVGLISVVYSELFLLAENTVIKIMAWEKWLIFLYAPAFMILSWLIVRKWAPMARGSGIPQVMAAMEVLQKDPGKNIQKALSIKVAFVKIVSSLFMALGGATVGREGPTIQITASVFKYVNNLIPSHWPKTNPTLMILAGASSGLAAAFNTPLGGIVFAVEELSKVHINHYKSTLFVAVIIAGLTAQAISGPYLYLGYPNVQGNTALIFLLIILVSILAGLLSSYMCRIILWIFMWKNRSLKTSFHHLLYICGCGLTIASIAYFVSPSIMGSGKELMLHILFSQNEDIPWYQFPLRYMGQIFSFTVGGSGGIFAPGLASGATLGAVVGNSFQMMPYEINLLVISGMVAFLTGITRTPFTSAILVLEMTDRHSVIFHLMLAAMVASWAAYFADKKSFYEHLKEGYIREIESNP